MDLAEEHRAAVDRFSCDCSHRMHSCLAEMYVSDDRFRAYYEGIRPGMAAYLHTAILANAARRAA